LFKYQAIVDVRVYTCCRIELMSVGFLCVCVGVFSLGGVGVVICRIYFRL